MTHPRRAQLLHTVRAWTCYAGGAVALCAAPFLARTSLPAGAAMLAVALALGLSGRLFARRAARYGVGARSEELVAEQLRRLEQLGWSVQHSVRWDGFGDIDHVLDVPGRVRFTIETKTSRYERQHVDRARAEAAHMAPPGRPCIPVICLVRRRGISTTERGVVIVSIDRLPTRLRGIAR